LGRKDALAPFFLCACKKTQLWVALMSKELVPFSVFNFQTTHKKGKAFLSFGNGIKWNSVPGNLQGTLAIMAL
jgi:hypothetical protein